MADVSEYIKIFLECNGSDGSTTFTDSSPLVNTVTANGNAQIDTAQSVAGGASCLLDGTGDYLTIPSNTEFSFLGHDFDITIYIRPVANPVANDHFYLVCFGVPGWVGNSGILAFGIKRDQGDSRNVLFLDYMRTGSVNETTGTENSDYVWNYTFNTWYKVRVRRIGENLKFTIDDIQLGPTYNIGSHILLDALHTVFIGAININGSPGRYFNGWIDDVYVSITHGSVETSASMSPQIIISDRNLTILADITKDIMNLKWEYGRIGGCGACSFEMPARIYEDLVLGANFNIKIYRRNRATNDYELWYQGRIEDKNYNVRGHTETITVDGMGYQSELSDIYINATYTSTEVSVIVKSILDTHIVPNTNITYDAADIEVTSFTPDSIDFNTDALSVIQTLADLVGTREWGVDRNRKFFFKERSSTVGFIYPIPSKVMSYSENNSTKEIVNRVIVTGGEVGGAPFTATYNDTTSQLKWNRRDKPIQNSAIITSQVAEQYADSIFAEFSDVVRRASVDLLEERLIERTTPIGLFQSVRPLTLYGQKKYGSFLYGGYISYQINRIAYALDNYGNMTINLNVGQLRPSISESISKLAFQIDQLRQQGV